MAPHLHSDCQREFEGAIATTRSDEHAVDNFYDSHDHVAAGNGLFLHDRRFHTHPLGGRIGSYADPRDTRAPANKLTRYRSAKEGARR